MDEASMHINNISLRTAAPIEKFRRASKNTEAWPSLKEWVDASTMVKYLKWFSNNVSGANQCTLVLDCYKAHRTDLVKSKAEKNSVELFFVPNCGTNICKIMLFVMRTT